MSAKKKSPFLSLREVAQIERIHPETAYRRAQAGRIPGAQKIGKEWRINRELFAKRRNLTLEQIAEALEPQPNA